VLYGLAPLPPSLLLQIVDCLSYFNFKKKKKKLDQSFELNEEREKYGGASLFRADPTFGNN